MTWTALRIAFGALLGVAAVVAVLVAVRGMPGEQPPSAEAATGAVRPASRTAPPAVRPTASPTSSASAPASPAPVPECTIGDERTPFDSIEDWQRTRLDQQVEITGAYEPNDLVPVGQAGVGGGGTVRGFVIADLKAMARAAQDDGAAFAVRSAYRSFADQADNFSVWANKIGPERAMEVSARAGHSEHQLGTTMDLRSASSTMPAWDYDDWGTTEPGSWLREHSWEHGFILSYPKGKTPATCYDYEPWHFRYVGRAEAAKVHSSGLTLREYLWRTFEAQG